MSEIFDGDRDYIGPYLRFLADQMGLRDWFLYHGHSTPQDEGHSEVVGGTCTPEEGRKSATIRLRSDWPSWDEEKFRHICVHELLHCHFAPVRDPLSELESLIGVIMFAPTWAATTSAMEYCIDGIAYDWGRLLPTPAEWLERETTP